MQADGSGRNPFVNQVSFFRCREMQNPHNDLYGRNPFVNQVSFFTDGDRID